MPNTKPVVKPMAALIGVASPASDGCVFAKNKLGSSI